MARRCWPGPWQSLAPGPLLGVRPARSQHRIMAGRSMRGHDASVLWRSLREVMPLSAAFLDGDHVEVIYPRTRSCVRAWPSWEVLELVRAEPAAMPDDEMAGRITQALGGHVVSTSIGPAGLAAALRTQDSYPPAYPVVIWSGSLQAMTPLQVRIWVDPCWSASGELAVTAFDGIRRGIVIGSCQRDDAVVVPSRLGQLPAARPGARWPGCSCRSLRSRRLGLARPRQAGRRRSPPADAAPGRCGPGQRDHLGS